MNLEDLYRLLRSSHVQAQGIVDTIDEPLVVLDERACVVEANRAFFSTFLVERDDTIGASLYSLGNGQWDIPELKRLISEIVPRSTAGIDYEVTHAFPVIGSRTFLLTARRLSRPDNNSTHVLLVFSDVTEARAREHVSSLLYAELRHRMSNLLGVVRAIANQTETKGRTAEEYKDAFMGRFQALITAQSLMASGGPSVNLVDLVSGVVGGLGSEKLIVSGGPSVAIAEEQVVPLTMVLHELGTNALKYGAFGQSGGTVEVSWEITAPSEGDRCLRLVWREKCKAPVAAPTETGTGTSIIEKSARLGLRGSAELRFENGGLVATLLIPLTGPQE